MSLQYFHIQKFIPQVGPEANLVDNDCGPAAALMCGSQFLEELPTVNQAFQEIQYVDKGTTINQLMKWLKGKNLECQYYQVQSGDQLKMLLNIGGGIALINQGNYLKLVPDFPRREFFGAHFIALAGYVQGGTQGAVACLNPYQTTMQFKGADIILIEDFMKMWDTNDSQDNPNRAFIHVTGLIQKTTKKARVLANILNIRAKTSVTAPIVGKFKFGQEFTYNQMDTMKNGDIWLTLKSNQFVCAKHNGQPLAEILKDD